MAAGVLNREGIEGILTRYKWRFFGKSIECVLGSMDEDASAFDVPLGTEYYSLNASIHPTREETVDKMLRRQKAKPRKLTDTTVFAKGGVYLVPVVENARLHPSICARATAKSSIGRLDALVRLVADKQQQFDRLDSNWRGKLYVEVIPLTFSLKVRPGLSLSQIRFIRGDEDCCTVGVRDLRAEECDVLVEKPSGFPATIDYVDGDSRAVLLTLDLSEDPAVECCGFKAKPPRGGAVVIDPKPEKNKIKPNRYWEKVALLKTIKGFWNGRS